MLSCSASETSSKKLPKVLLIADLVGGGYVNIVRGLQHGYTEVRVPKGANGNDSNGGGTTKGVAEIDAWLGDEKWDLVYFNFGLHDMMSADPGNPNRASHNPNDPAQASPEVYESNLRTIVEKLKATGAKLVFANTIPFRQENRRPFRRADQVAVYNGIAENVMKENGIEIHDLHGFVKPRMEELMNSRGVGFTRDGGLEIALEVSSGIEKALGIQREGISDKRAKALLLGDSVSLGYTPFVRGMLYDAVNVDRPKNEGGGYLNCQGTFNGLANIDAWLGDGDWDVIHFNFGLHDLKHVLPGEPSKNSADPSHPQQSDPDTYDANLREIVAKLKATGARLIFANTTPFPDKPGGPLRRADQAAIYNAVAAKIMEENDIPINNLHDFVLPQMEALMPPNNVHFTQTGSFQLALQVVSRIEAALEN